MAWWDFLKKDEKHWPVSHHIKEIQKDVEVKVAVSVNATNAYENTLNKLICHYSEWHRLTRAVSWVMKLKELLHKLSAHRKLLTLQTSERLRHERKTEIVANQMQKFKTTISGSLLTTEEITLGEIEIIKLCQMQGFSDELMTLQKGDKLKRSSHTIKLDPVVKDGILRVGGRLHQSALPADA